MTAWFLFRTLVRPLDLAASEYRHILRIAGKDIEGDKKITVALNMVKGIGHNLAQVILQSININPNMRVGFVTEKELNEIELAIKNPSRIGVPSFYLNRRKDMDTGSDRHLITSDLEFITSNDIEREKSVMSWRGYRHMFGLKVRGQHTRTSGRKGGAVGVKRIGKLAPAAGPPGSEAPAPTATPTPVKQVPGEVPGEQARK